MIDGAPAPALVLQQLPAKAKGTWTAPESIELAARSCARAIRDLLVLAREGRATRRDGDAQRPIEPRDCAVLVRSHREGIAIRDALTHLGVPAVSAGRGSLYETDEAQQLLALLLALSTPGDERRLRAVLATPLFGHDAAMLQALEADGDARRRWQQDLADWRLRWESHGPQPMLADVVAREAARMLAFADGERRITHLLQLGEQLQEARAHRLGPQGQVDWLRAAIAHADREDETQWPNLESDASRVQILTLHKSKGLEFPLVFLPFAGIGRTTGGKARVVQYHDASGQRVRQWKTRERHAGAPPWEEATQAAKREDAAEDMRLLYVGLTRARDAMWLATGPLASNAQSSLHRLFGGMLPRADLIGGNIDVRAPEDAIDDTRLPPAVPDAIPAPRTPHRRLRRDWWIHSFSQLHRQNAHGAQALAEEAPADDERPLAVFETIDPALLRFSGTRFGNALHHALEHVDFAAWRDARRHARRSARDPVRCAALAGLPGKRLRRRRARTRAAGRAHTHRAAARRRAPVRRAGRGAHRGTRVPFHARRCRRARVARVAAAAWHRRGPPRFRRVAEAQRPDDRQDRPDLSRRRPRVRHRLQVQSPARLGCGDGGASDGGERIRPAGVAVRGRDASLAAHAAGQPRSGDERLRRRALSLLPRPGCRPTRNAASSCPT